MKQSFTQEQVREIIRAKLNSENTRFIECFDIGKLWISAYYCDKKQYVSVSICHRRESFFNKNYKISLKKKRGFKPLTDEINRLHEIVEMTRAKMEGY